jgi:hypothetical protein
MTELHDGLLTDPGPAFVLSSFVSAIRMQRVKRTIFMPDSVGLAV